jgi:hypothetical protein
VGSVADYPKYGNIIPGSDGYGLARRRLCFRRWQTIAAKRSESAHDEAPVVHKAAQISR